MHGPSKDGYLSPSQSEIYLIPQPLFLSPLRCPRSDELLEVTLVSRLREHEILKDVSAEHQAPGYDQMALIPSHICPGLNGSRLLSTALISLFFLPTIHSITVQSII
jgi:hypothetical protein